MRPSTLYLLLILTIVAPVSVSAYEVSTHRDLALRAAAAASDLHRSLIEDLGQTEGRDTVLRSGVTELSVAKWLQYGAGEEDQPFWRVRHHFHDPLRAWDSAGLSTALGVEIEVGQSSIVWSQRAVQEGSRGGGTWSWPSARQRFLAAQEATVAYCGRRGCAAPLAASIHGATIARLAATPLAQDPRRRRL